MTDATKGCCERIDSYAMLDICSRDGKGYCWQHDPVAVAKRFKERNDKRVREPAGLAAKRNYQFWAVLACQRADLSVEALEQGVAKELVEFARWATKPNGAYSRDHEVYFRNILDDVVTKAEAVLAKIDAEAEPCPVDPGGKNHPSDCECVGITSCPAGSQAPKRAAPRDR